MTSVRDHSSNAMWFHAYRAFTCRAYYTINGLNYICLAESAAAATKGADYKNTEAAEEIVAIPITIKISFPDEIHIGKKVYPLKIQLAPERTPRQRA